MTGNLISRYVWLVDTLTRYGKLTRDQINDLWLRSSLSDGKAIPERTFFHYRRAIELTFRLDIKCNTRGEYYIEQPASGRERAYSSWLLNSHSATAAFADNADLADRVMFEEVPSAREFLPAVLEAIKAGSMINFTYAGFNRSRPEADIRFSPWGLRLYKQRWYMIGLREKGNAVRTYALDRVKVLTVCHEKMTVPEGLDIETLFKDLVGITSSSAEPREVVLRTTSMRQAKYLRALPLHSSQKEEVADGYSIFRYRLKINYELVHEILALGPQVMVVAPKELRSMVVDELRKTLMLYEPSNSNDKFPAPCPTI